MKSKLYSTAVSKQHTELVMEDRTKKNEATLTAALLTLAVEKE